MGVTLELNVVTPEKLILSQEIFSVVVPGADGDFGVLSGHAPLLSAIRSGRLEVETADDDVSYIVSSGFAEVQPERVTILVDKALLPTDIDLDKAKEDVASLGKQLTSLSEEDPDYPDLKCQFNFAEACVNILKKK